MEWLAGVGLEASVDERLVSTVVSESCLDNLLGQPVVVGYLPDVTIAARGSASWTMRWPAYSKKELLFIKGLIEDGHYRPVIDRCYPLEQVVEATRYVETQQKTGNAVLTVTPLAAAEAEHVTMRSSASSGAGV